MPGYHIAHISQKLSQYPDFFSQFCLSSLMPDIAILSGTENMQTEMENIKRI